MKKYLVAFLFSSVFCNSMNMELLSFIGFGQNTSDITGFNQDDREFAVVGLQNSAAFIDITDPYNPYEIGRISGGSSMWRDVKYWNGHVYIGTEATDGVKVVSVLDPDNPTLVSTIQDFGNSHNIHIDKDGYLYVIGASTNDMWIYDLAYPANPVLVGTWNGEYLHDIEVFDNKVYGAAIYSGYFYIIDVSDKSNPSTLVSFNTGGGYISTHDCAVTDDAQVLITADETTGGHLKFWDISDYDNINLLSEYITPEGFSHSSHNVYVRPGTDLAVCSYYADGTRVIDISDPSSPEEIAYYDTTDIEGLFVGNWGTYAYLESGNIISSDIETGMYVMSLNFINIAHDQIENQDATEPVEVEAVVDTYSGDILSVDLNYKVNSTWEVVPMIQSLSNTFSGSIPPQLDGSVVEYYISATNTEGQTNTSPSNAPGNFYSYIVGSLATFEVESLDVMPQGEDSFWDPGESSTLSASITNTGTGSFGDMSVSFTSSSEYIQISEILPVFSDLDPGESISIDVEASASPDTPLGTSVEVAVSTMPLSDCEGTPGCPPISQSIFFTTIGITISSDLPVPIGLSASPNEASIDLSWSNPLDCQDGYILDCSLDGDCCPEAWIGDGFGDCQDQAYGCDLSCYDSDGGDCGEVQTCEDQGLVSCWDGTCAGSENECPQTCDEQGLYTCDDGSCVGSSDECSACEDSYVSDCSDDDCCPESWIGDGLCDGEEQAYGCDLSCFDNDGGDCGGMDVLNIFNSSDKQGYIYNPYNLGVKYGDIVPMTDKIGRPIVGFNIYKNEQELPDFSNYLAFTQETIFSDYDIDSNVDYCYSVNLLYQDSMSLLSAPDCAVIQSNSISGDINADGVLDILDIVMMINIIVGAYSPSTLESQSSDMNNDGAINVQDIVLLVNEILE